MRYKGPDTGNSKKAVPKSALRLPMQKQLGRPKFKQAKYPEEFRDRGLCRILNFADGLVIVPRLGVVSMEVCGQVRVV